MKIKITESNGIHRILVDRPTVPIQFEFSGSASQRSLMYFDLSINRVDGSYVIEKPLGLREHVIGLGEKAVELDRRRKRYVMWNLDPGMYQKFQDPLYVNIPFITSINNGKAIGFFINSASKVIFDIGFEDYGKIKMIVPDNGVELYVFDGPTIENVMERYSSLTGHPFLPPKWSLGYMISRYTYYPQEKIIELLDLLKSDGFNVTGVFLDIDFMDSYKLFTWSKDRFPSPQKFIDEVHARGVKVITIVDHSIRADQNYSIFRDGMGMYCELPNGELFVGKMWPGNSVYPDFFNERARAWWAKLISKWVSQGIDGIWLDMDEPTDFTKINEINDIMRGSPIAVRDDRYWTAFPDNVIHRLGNKQIPHALLRNAYPVYEAMATFEGMTKSGKEPFILSRAGYAGIQRYAFVWTADGTPSWDQLRLQLQLVLGLSVSGVPYVGIDIGGFQGRGSPLIDNSTELLLRYYQAAMFFPLYRTHKATDGIDTEPIYLPKHYKERVREAINLRYTFMSYMYNLVIEAHLHGHPIVRPLFYEFQDDEDMYRIDDEYMVGRHVLFAPILYPQTNDRSVILPRGDWMDFWTKKRVSGVVRSSSDVPIYIRTNSIILLDNGDLIVTGQGGETYGDIAINADQNGVVLSKQTRINKLIILGSHNKAYVDGKMVDASIDGDATIININGAVKAVRVE